MPLIQTYQSGATDKRPRFIRTDTGDYSVKHYQGGSAVRQIPVPGGQDPHMIAKSYVSETLVQTYQSGETNRRSEVHKDPNTGDYSVKHYHHGAAVKHVKVAGDQDPHTIAKRYIKEQTCPVCGSQTKIKALRCKNCIKENFNAKAAQSHKARIDYNDPSTHRHADASTEHLLAIALKQQGDHENAAKASERAKRFSKALKEGYKIISYGSGAKHKVIHNGATIAQGMTLDQAKAHVKDRQAKSAAQKAAFKSTAEKSTSPHSVFNEGMNPGDAAYHQGVADHKAGKKIHENPHHPLASAGFDHARWKKGWEEREELLPKHRFLLDKLQEDGAAAVGAPTNNAGSGAVAGLGVGPQGEPGRKKSRVMKVLRRKAVNETLDEGFMKPGDTAHTVTLRYRPNAADRSRLYRYHVVAKHNKNPEAPHGQTVAHKEALKVHHATYPHHEKDAVSLHSVTTGHAQHANHYGGDNQHKGSLGQKLVDKLKGRHPTVKPRSNEVNETLGSGAEAGDYVKDFVDSDNKMFSDSKKQRIKRALGAYYAKKNK